MLKYKGYTGIVEYDAEGKIFTGELIGLRSVITFQGRNPEELETSFRESIELFLDMCKEDGVTPEMPYSGRFNIRIPSELHREIVIRAAADRKSLNEWVTEALEKSV